MINLIDISRVLNGLTQRSSILTMHLEVDLLEGRARCVRVYFITVTVCAQQYVSHRYRAAGHCLFGPARINWKRQMTRSICLETLAGRNHWLTHSLPATVAVEGLSGPLLD